MLEHYATGQVAKLGIDGSKKMLGTPGIYTSLFISPDGKHLLVTRIQRPFSYLRPMRGFPKQIEVWSTESGEREHVLVTLPADENIPIEGVRTGPRAVEWNFAEPATLVWTEALDVVTRTVRFRSVTAMYHTDSRSPASRSSCLRRSIADGD